jgi:hypothetical protein
MSDLEDALSKCRVLLDEVGETFWSEKISEALSVHHGNEVSLCGTVRGWIGSMGSLSDLMIHPLNGHNVRPEEARLKNDQFADLRTAVYDSLSPSTST